MSNLLVAAFRFLNKQKWLFWLLLSGSIFLFAFFAAKNVFTDDIQHIFPENKQLQNTQQLLNELNLSNKYTLIFHNTDSIEDTDKLINAVSELSASLSAKYKPNEYRIEAAVADNDIQAALAFIPDNAPLYYTVADYQQIEAYLNSDSLLQQKINQDYEKLLSITGAGYKNNIDRDPLGLCNSTLKTLSKLNINDSLELYQQYIFDKKHESLLAFLYISEPTKGKEIAASVQAALDSVTKENPSITTYFLGAEVFANSNATQIKKDIYLVLFITLIALVSILAAVYRNKFAPILLMSPVVYGLLFAGFVNYWLKGSISVIAIGAVSIIIGIAINYSLHYFSHLNHNNNIEKTLTELWQPLTIGSFTTVAALFSLTFTSSPILQDFGFLGGFALIGAAIFTLFFLPHLIRPATTINKLDFVFQKINHLFHLSTKQSIIAVFVIVILTVFFATQLHKVKFEEDMNSFNYMDKATQTAVEKTDRLLDTKSSKKLFLAIKENETNQLLAKQVALSHRLDSLEKIGIITSHISIGDLILNEQIQLTQIKKWNSFWQKHDKIAFENRIQFFADKAGFSKEAFSPFYSMLQSSPKIISTEKFAPLAAFGGDNLWIKNDSGSILLTAVTVPKENLPTFFDFFDNSIGITILDKAFMTRELVADLKNNFNYVLIISSLIVFLALYISYGRIELAILAFLPMTISWIWIVGIMGLLGIHFNLINIIISTFIFGIGDDFSIFTVDALTDEYKTGRKTIAVNRESILLSLVTTLLGMGVLIFAKHPALKSIAVISIIGVFAVFIVSQLLQPILVNLFLLKRKEKRQAPYTIFGFLRSVFAFFYFVFGAFLLTFLGFIIMYLLPISKQKRKYLFHYLLSKFVKSLVYIMFNTKKVFIDKQHLNFDEPSIIIANHQSFLDILITVMLHPKLILLTNEWVWNSPVFGRVVKMADYYPVFNGAEDGLEKFEKITKEGYSIVVFPEGTRSTDGTIKRFHKGAFFIAEKLNLPIRPIVLHGICDTMRKGDFQLMNGTMTLNCLPPIYPTDTTFGYTYSEKTKNISAYFKKVYADMKTNYETPRYFADAVEHAYLFKGPVLEWYTKVKIKIEKYYEPYHSILPKSGTIADIGCGYGYMTYLLQLSAPDRNFISIDFDDEKIAIAQNCYLKNEKTQFICADITDYKLPTADVYIFNDVLHYLPKENQKNIITTAMQSLNKEGFIIIKDGNSTNQSKHKFTKLTEFISTNIGFNNADFEKLEFVGEDFWKQIATENNFAIETMIESKYTSNYYLILKRKHETV